ncbi:hypothetical protein WJX81_000770 [Elliptochloris bilobata]|uniref:Wings apart-like protein C-terminal domain-containing protein n=1 Tax=Elliptochloris bilobata TaxID=381761 RepID=A0AAW1RBF3_9CHLO
MWGAGQQGERPAGRLARAAGRESQPEDSAGGRPDSQRSLDSQRSTEPSPREERGWPGARTPRAPPAPRDEARKGPNGRAPAHRARLGPSGLRPPMLAQPPPAAPATTVMEAQESGEQCGIADDVRYALDGLAAGPRARRDGAVALAEVAASRRGRLVLRAEGLLGDVLAAGGRAAPAASDEVADLGFAVLALGLAGEEACQAALASRDAAALLCRLMQVDTEVQAGDSSAARLLRLLRETPLSRALPAAEASSPASVALAALTTATNPRQASGGCEAVKAALREHAILAAVAALAARHAVRLDGVCKRSAARALWGLHRCLAVFEHATFACPANERALVGLYAPGWPSGEADPAQRCSDGGAQAPAAAQAFSPSSCEGADSGASGASAENKGDGEAAEPAGTFPAWLIAQARALAGSGSAERASDPGNPAPLPGRGPWREALHCALSVVVNVTNGSSGCGGMLNAGGLEAAARVVDAVMGPPELEAAFARITDRRRLVEGADLVNVALGALINLAEHAPAHRARFVAVPLPAGRRLLPLLCRVLQATAALPGSPAAARRGSGGGGEEVTEAALAARQEEGVASFAEFYAAVLLGILVERDTLLCQEAAGLLPEGGLAAVAATIEHGLRVHLIAGALTPETEVVMRRLHGSLRAVAAP